MGEVTLDISEARSQFNTLDKRFREEGVNVIRITRHNKDAFAVVDIEYLSAVLETLEILADPEAVQMLQDSIADIRASRLHDHEDIEREFM